MFILKLAGKILLLPVWLILFVIGLAVKMTVQTYAVVRGILGFIFTLLIIATAYCYHDWVQVAFLFSLSVILYLILFAGVFVDTVLDMTRESSADLVVSINTLHSSIVIQSFLLILSMKKAVDHN